MAELRTDPTPTSGCCAPETQANCCEPADKDACCGTGRRRRRLRLLGRRRDAGCDRV